MTTLKCPKCRQYTPDVALDAGQCPACGFPLDGPLVLDTGARGMRVRPFLLGALLVAGVGAYALVQDRPSEVTQGPREVADAHPEPLPAGPETAPLPHAPKPRGPEKPSPITPPSAEPKNDKPRPVGVVMKVDPKITPTRHFDHPDDTAALPDLNTTDRVVLTGRVRGLRIGSVNGKGQIDASGLVAEEIIITGDLNNEAVVQVNAPNGKVSLGGYIGGRAKLTVTASGGEVLLLASSGRVTGSAVATITTKKLDLAGKLRGAARLDATLTAGGSFKFALIEEGATVTYKQSAAADPPLKVDLGTISGGGKVLAQ